MMNKILAMALLATASSLPMAAQAASTSDSFQVRLSLVGSCSIESVENLDFGTLSVDDVSSGTQTETGDIGIACSKGTSYDIGLSGTNGTRTLRSHNGSTVSYELYQDSGNSIDWDNISVLSGTGTGTMVTHTVSGHLPGTFTLNPNDQVSGGAVLKDVVTVTLTF